MCGIVGFYKRSFSYSDIARLTKLVKESKIRGLHSFGYSEFGENGLRTLIKLSPIKEGEVRAAYERSKCIIFHNRYCTSGDWQNPINNQPISNQNSISVAMNGVISMAPKEEYEKEYDVKCVSENDSEIFLRLLERSSEEAISRTKGAWAAVYIKEGELFAARNKYRPLFYYDSGSGAFCFSTADIGYRAGLNRYTAVPIGKEVHLSEEYRALGGL